jgi:hypothetical protein
MTIAPTDLVVPPNWTINSEGMSRDGFHALDLWAGLDANGQIAVGVKDKRMGIIRESPTPPDWFGTESEWAVYYLTTECGMRPLGDEQNELLRTFLDDLYELKSHLHGARLAERFPGLTPELDELMWSLAQYVYLVDIDYILATLAAGVVAVDEDSDPLWLMLVLVSSAGKGEALHLLYDVADERLKDLTLAGLITVTQGKTGRAAGLLMKYVDKNALFTVTDFSALLGDARRSGESKTDLFNALRDIYDREYRRDMNKGAAHWQGRLSMVAACTPAIDDFTAHGDSLGTRWLYFRQDESGQDAREDKAKMVIGRQNLENHRLEARAAATTVIEQARSRLADVVVPDTILDVIVKAAVLVGYGRASVPRDWHGDISGVVHTEEPGRFTGQLYMLARGLLALGVEDEVVLRIVRHAAVSSMPLARSRVLKVLSRSPDPLSVNKIAIAADMNRKVAARALEDWEAVDAAVSEKNTDAVTTISARWTLTTTRLELVRAVFPS